MTKDNGEEGAFVAARDLDDEAPSSGSQEQGR